MSLKSSGLMSSFESGSFSLTPIHLPSGNSISSHCSNIDGSTMVREGGVILSVEVIVASLTLFFIVTSDRLHRGEFDGTRTNAYDLPSARVEAIQNITLKERRLSVLFRLLFFMWERD